MTTHAADSLSTDSAAAAHRLSEWLQKAKIGAIGMCADGTVPKPLWKSPREKGCESRLVTNATVYDASPAAFRLSRTQPA